MDRRGVSSVVRDGFAVVPAMTPITEVGFSRSRFGLS
jgi:hypothetical protein